MKYISVDEYIAGFPAARKKILNKIRKIIREAAPHAEELISYNMPAFKLNGFLVSYAAWKDHLGMYPVTSATREKIPGLSVFEASKGTLKFPFDQPIPYKLIEKYVKIRVRENLEKPGGKVKKK
jgi:uncharacterized protein YdhG (YjbR/CyaY superfamily)